MVKNVKKYLQMRKVIEQFFETVAVFVQENLENATISQVKLYNTGLNDNYGEFFKIQSIIEDLDETELDSTIRVRLDKQFYILKPALEEKLIELTEAKRAACPAHAPPEELAFKPKLPELALDSFYGDISKWKSFLESFDNHVHRNPKLNNITKFQYLRNTVKGSAAKTFENLDFVSDNYEEARNLLIERFDKPNYIAEEHIRALFSIKRLERATSKNLLDLLDDFNSHLRSLKNLGRPTDYWDDLIIYLMASKFDSETTLKWREEAPADRLPQYEDVSKFLKSRSHKIGGYKIEGPSTSNHLKFQSKPSFETNFNRSRSSLVTVNQYYCALCKRDGHTIMRCHQFFSLSVSDRRNSVEKLELCFNCLRSTHYADKCKLSDSCHICKARHHTLLHLDSTNTSSPPSVNTLAATNNPTPSISSGESNAPSTSSVAAITSSSLASATDSSYIILGTVIIEVLDNFGTPVSARAVLDSGSQVNFMTNSFASKLGKSFSNSTMQIRGLGTSSVKSLRSSVISIRSRHSQYSTSLEVQLLPEIVGKQPSIKLNTSDWKIPPNIKLADPYFKEPRSIDILLGAEVFYELLYVGKIKLGENLPFLQNTAFGWMVSGRADGQQSQTPFCGFVSKVDCEEKVDNLLQKFWEVESCDSDIKKDSFFDTECDKHFVKTVSRNPEGRFAVKLPFLQSPDVLGNSSDQARRRFINLEKRLERHSNLQLSYNEFMSEYIRLGHMELVENIAPNNFYLPHHCVLRPDSTTTKLRVVFDGSARSSSGLSLNDILMTGPVVQSELFAIILRFRSHVFAICGDIEKMYRQIQVHESDQHFQYIFWRFDPSKELQTYKLNTVTYGTTSAPYQATRCLVQLAIESESEYPIPSTAIRNDIYVDDFLSGANSIHEAIKLREDVSSILKTAGMTLRKWCANNPAILKDVKECDRETLIKFDQDVFVKTLGILWQAHSDMFRFKLNVSDSTTSSTVTKRSVISRIAKIFDPTGFVSPVVVIGKLFLQKLWLLKVDWDESLPTEYNTYWINFQRDLLRLDELNIPRHIFNGCQNPTSIQLHGFSDSSEKAYGAVIYVRYSAGGTFYSRILCSKSRIAPLKKTTLPRLELCAAQLLAGLMKKVLEFLNFKIDDIFYWSDSMITLHWISSPSSRWKTFVANRVSDIQAKTDMTKWRYVQSKSNPADYVSRGLSSSELISSDLWWNGPQFLMTDDEYWSKPFSASCNEEDVLETKTIHSLISVQSGAHSDVLQQIHRQNNYRTVRNAMAYVGRFIHNSRHPKNRSLGPLSIDELERGLVLLLRAVQSIEFREVYTGLRKSNYIIRDPTLKSLSLFLDKDNVLRVGGRLQFSALQYTSRHPALLPSKHFVTLTILNYFHRKNLHVGPQGLLAAARQKFWPISGRQLCKRVCRQCVLCNRAQPRLMSQQMAPLPPERVNVAPPFFNVGVDYAGPFFIHHHSRGRAPTKTYLAVFVCTATKAIHLELASDLSSKAFIGAFRRFIATRGKCRKIISDNGTNFVGANNELHGLYQLLHDMEFQKHLTTTALDDEIIWSFAPPNSPHFGGLYEAGVKSAKHHLRRMIGSAKLSFEELNTLIKQIEAILNSRPLTPLATDNELDVLTPGHFLIGRPLTAIPEPTSEDDRNINALRRWELVDHLHKQFWVRWSKEYLHQLHHRYYWQDKTRNLPIGSIVIVRDDNQPPLKWKLGKVVELHPGKDNLVRVVSIKTATGLMKRAITNLGPLPIEVELSSVQGGEDDGDDQ